MAELKAQIKNKRCERQWEQLKDFLRKIKSGISVSLIVVIAIHIASIVIGSVNLKKCSVEQNIPVFLITIGVIGIVTKVLGLARELLSRWINVNPIICLVGVAEFICFICGSVWVFSIFQPSYDPDDLGRNCDRTTYMFAFVYLCCIYLVLLVFLTIVIIFCCTFAVACRHLCADDDDVPA